MKAETSQEARSEDTTFQSLLKGWRRGFTAHAADPSAHGEALPVATSNADPASPAPHAPELAHGGGNPPPPDVGNNNGGDGNGGGSNLKAKWDGLGKFTQVIILLIVALAFSHLYTTFTSYQNHRANEAQNDETQAAALAEQRLALIKAETARIVASTPKPVPVPDVTLSVVPYQLQNCLTPEETIQVFEGNKVINGVKGSMLLLSPGCGWVSFDHPITSLSGEGYLITFDGVLDPQPNYIGYGKAGRNDSAQTVIDTINKQIGRKFRVLIDNPGANGNTYLKIGG